MIAAITTTATAGPVTALLQSRGDSAAAVHPGDNGQGSAVLAGLARTPVDVLLLDVDAGVGPADVARFRLAQSQARVILLAPGRQPGDRLVAQICAAAEVRDVCADLGLLADVLDHPADFATALRWRDPNLAPEAHAGPAAPTVVERRVAVGTHPVIIAVAGLDRGTGATTVAAAVAAFTARLGHDTALIELGDRGLRLLCSRPRWLPHLDTFPGQQDATAILQERRYPYIVVDAGSLALASDVPVVPTVGAPADVTLLILPSARWRYLPLDHVLRRWSQAAPLPWLLLNGVDPETRDQVRYLIEERAQQRHLSLQGIATFPALPEPRDMPPGARQRLPALDEALTSLLKPVLPDAAPVKRRGLFAR